MGYRWQSHVGSVIENYMKKKRPWSWHINIYGLGKMVAKF